MIFPLPTFVTPIYDSTFLLHSHFAIRINHLSRRVVVAVGARNCGSLFPPEHPAGSFALEPSPLARTVFLLQLYADNIHGYSFTDA